MFAPVVQQTPVKPSGTGPLGDGFGGQIGQLLVAVLGFKMRQFVLEFPGVARLGRQVQIAGAQLAVDIVLVDQVTDLLHRIKPELPEALCGFFTNPFFNAGLICSLARAHMASISTGGAPGNALCLEEDDVVAFLAQVKCAR